MVVPWRGFGIGGLGRPAGAILDLFPGRPRPGRALLPAKGALPKVISCCLTPLNALLDLRKSGFSALALRYMLVLDVTWASA
mgnify:CR=1 FL=1